MDLALIKLSIERMLEKVENLEKQNSKLKKRIKKIEEKNVESVNVSSVSDQENQDVLIDTKEVLEILGICYNTLQSIIRKKLIIPIRINQRRIRFSKQSIFDYIKTKGMNKLES